jgi:hypothetical protein
MADFRARYAAGDPTGWNAVDLGEYLLDYVPRKVGLDDDNHARFPQAVTQVLRVLGETGRLEPRTAEFLGASALSATERFVDRARDLCNFGPAMALTQAMLADGVDLSDQRAVDRWIVAYNKLPEDERHQRVPAFAHGGFFAALSPSPPARPTSRKRRKTAKACKTQRQARRRNRRR